MLRHFQGAVSHKAPKAPSFSSGEIQRGPAGPLWSFQLGRFAGGEDFVFFPSCVSFSLLPFFWTSKRKEGSSPHTFLGSPHTPSPPPSIRQQKNADQWSALLSRSCRAVFVCFSFPSRGIGKRKHRVRQCLYWLTQSPPGLRCFSGAAGQIRTATAHSAKALFPVMLFPFAALAQWEVGSSISKYTQKSRYPNGYLLFWSCWADSNCRPHPYQGCALPTELQQQIVSPFFKGLTWRPRRDLNPRPPA